MDYMWILVIHIVAIISSIQDFTVEVFTMKSVPSLGVKLHMTISKDNGDDNWE